MNLYRLTVKSNSVFSDYKSATFYAVADDVLGAKRYLSTHLKDGYKITKVALMGEALGYSLFAGSKKK